MPTICRRLGCVCASGLLAAPAVARAPTGLDAIVALGVLRVGLTGDCRPFSFRDPASDTVSGLDVDMAQLLADGMGVRLEIVPTRGTA